MLRHYKVRITYMIGGQTIDTEMDHETLARCLNATHDCIVHSATLI